MMLVGFLRLGALVLVASLFWGLALATTPSAPDGFTRVQRLMDQERWAEAREALPEGAVYEYNLGVILHAEGRHEEALACLVDYGPSEDLAFSLYAAGRFDEAAGVFGRLLSDDPLTSYNLASALHEAGQDSLPLLYDVLARSQERDPVHVMAMEDLAEELASSDSPEQASRVFEQAEYLDHLRSPWQTADE